MFLFDSNSFQEIPFPKDSVFINDHICLINTTDIPELHFEEPENGGATICEILTFNEFQGEDPQTFQTQAALVFAVRRSLYQENFNAIEFELNIEECFHAPCSFTIDNSKNETILNGTSILCDQSKGVVIKSKSQENFQSQFKRIYIFIIFLGFTESNQIAFIMISESSFAGLELYKQDQFDLENEPTYEQVSGFEPLRNVFK